MATVQATHKGLLPGPDSIQGRVDACIMGITMRVSVVVVNWNVKELLQSCLASVLKESGSFPAGSVEIIVVDNASSDGSAEMVREQFPQARLLANAENRGFSAACNQAIAGCTGDAVLLLNPDAELLPGSLGELAGWLERHPAAAAVGPRMLNADGTIQSSRRRFPTLATAFLESTILQSYLPKLSHLSRYYCLDQPEDHEQQVDWLVGACLLLRRKALQEVGPLDEQFFLYFEETDWCLRAKRAGWQIAYLPDAQVLHHYGQSSGQDLRLRHIYFTDSKCRYYRKHFGPAAGRLVRWFLLVSYALQMVEESIKLALGHKVAVRRQRIALLGSVLKWGLKG